MFCPCLLEAVRPLQAPAGTWYGAPEDPKALGEGGGEVKCMCWGFLAPLCTWSSVHMCVCAQVVREFARPEGVAAEEMDAIVEGEVMAVLDLRPDEALREAGLAREVVNRVQKLRKKAGLLVGSLPPVSLSAFS